MSRYYNMTVTITGGLPEHLDAVKAAVESEWDFDDWSHYDGALTASADGKLCAGETDQQFAERLAKAVWAANGRSCQVDVKATYLEDLPYEDFLFDEDDYVRLMTPQGGVLNSGTTATDVTNSCHKRIRVVGGCYKKHAL